MKKNVKLSIIVPVYNAEKYIDRCLESILAQTFTDYEVILVNDGSQDNSEKICRRYQSKDERIIALTKENGGAGSARNMGIELACGDYLAFPDVDDWFAPTMYEELYAAAIAGNYDVVFSGVNFYTPQEDGAIKYSRTMNCDAVAYTTQDECRENVMHFFPTSTIFDVPWNKLYKRAVVMDYNIRFSDTRRCQDAMFNIDFYNVIHSAVSVERAYYNYIENSLTSTQNKFPKNYIDINIRYFSKLIQILSSWGIYSGEIKKHYDTSFIIAVYETMGMFENPVWKFSHKEKQRYIKDIISRPEVQEMLISADVKEDESYKAEILRNHDYRRFMKRYQIEKIKNRLRKNEILRRMYHILKY